MRLASRFGYTNQIHRDRPLTHEELMLRIPLYSITDWHRSPISDSHTFDQPGT